VRTNGQRRVSVVRLSVRRRRLPVRPDGFPTSDATTMGRLLPADRPYNAPEWLLDRQLARLRVGDERRASMSPLRQKDLDSLCH